MEVGRGRIKVVRARADAIIFAAQRIGLIEQRPIDAAPSLAIGDRLVEGVAGHRILQERIRPGRAAPQDGIVAITTLIIAIAIGKLAAETQPREGHATQAEIDVARYVDDGALVFVFRIDRPDRKAFERHDRRIGQVEIGVERCDALIAQHVAAKIEGQIAARTAAGTILYPLDRRVEAAARPRIADPRFDLPAAKVQLHRRIELQILVRLIHIFAVVADARTPDRARDQPSVLDHRAGQVEPRQFVGNIIGQPLFDRLVIELRIEAVNVDLERG